MLLVNRKAGCLLLCSGGMDSVVAGHWALRHYNRVEVLAFAYGQRNHQELQYAKLFAAQNELPYTCMDLSTVFAQTSANPLMGGDGSVAAEPGVDRPATYIRNRNAFFLTAAHTLAQERGLGTLVTGLVDAGALDCTVSFTEALLVALNNGDAGSVQHVGPLQRHWSKAHIWAQAEREGCLREVVEQTLSCYAGVMDLNEWGRGCGECTPCVTRREGLEEFNAKTLFRS